MKARIWLFFSFLSSISLQSQVTLEHVYSGDVKRIWLELSGEKYSRLNRESFTIELFNSDHTLWKTIELSTDTLGKDITSYTVSEHTFNLDYQVEVMFLEVSKISLTYRTKIVNETGQSLLDVPGIFNGVDYVSGDGINVLVIDSNSVVYSLHQSNKVHTYSNYVQLLDIEGVGLKYVEVDIPAKTIKIHNLDHTLYKTIVVALPQTTSYLYVTHLSKSKIIADTQLEGIIQSENNEYFIFNESGQILLKGYQFARVSEIHGRPDKLTLERSVYSLPGLILEYTYYPFPFRIDLEYSGPKYLAGFNDSVNLYNTDHSPFLKQKVPISQGHHIQGYYAFNEALINDDSLVETVYSTGDNWGNYEGRIVNQQNVDVLKIPNCSRFFVSKIGNNTQNKLLASIVVDSSDILEETRVYSLPSYDLVELKETSPNKDIAVFPNPASEIIHVESARFLQNIRVFDILGKETSPVNFLKTGDVDVSSLVPGTYFMVILMEDGSQHFHKQIITEKK